MKILALDYGKKRIGLALSDALGIAAHPYGYFEAGDAIFKKISEMVDAHQVSEIVLGHPKTLKGESGPMAKEVETFAEKLKTFVHVPIHLWDERLTSSQTENVLIEANVRREKRKHLRDSIAATLILQSYMSYKSGKV